MFRVTALDHFGWLALPTPKYSLSKLAHLLYGAAAVGPVDAPFQLLHILDNYPRYRDEIVMAMRKRRIAGSRSAVWRFFQRHNISVKKKACGQRSKSEPT